MAFEPAQHSFITLEGVDGAGKSTQARLLARVLDLAGYQVVTLREPGGTAISEKIRALLLDPANTAALGYRAWRASLSAQGPCYSASWASAATTASCGISRPYARTCSTVCAKTSSMGAVASMSFTRLGSSAAIAQNPW